MLNYGQPISMVDQHAAPGVDNDITYIYDSTMWNSGATIVAAQTAAAPGKSKGQLAGAKVSATVLAGTTGVSATCEVLVGAGTTNASWKTDATGPGTAGVVTVTAGTISCFNWTPVAPDHRIKITTTTKPTALNTTCVLSWPR